LQRTCATFIVASIVSPTGKVKVLDRKKASKARYPLEKQSAEQTRCPSLPRPRTKATTFDREQGFIKDYLLAAPP